MSTTPRTRVSRAEQRARTRNALMAAATELFAAQGISSTSLEEIAETAGYSRGAFYSNFADRDALVLALIERHQAQSMAETHELLAANDSADGFLAAMLQREYDQPIERSQLSMEYILWASRNPESRARLRELNARVLEQIDTLIGTTFQSRNQLLPIPTLQAAKIVLALDEGFALLRLIDPETYHRGIWGEAVSFLSDATAALSERMV